MQLSNPFDKTIYLTPVHTGKTQHKDMKRFLEYLISDEGFEKMSNTLGWITISCMAILIIYNLFIRL